MSIDIDINSTIDDIIGFTMSDLNSRYRIARNWGLTKEQAEYAVHEGIKRWQREENKDLSLGKRSKAFTSRASDRVEPSRDTLPAPVQEEQAQTKIVEGERPHPDSAYDRALASYQSYRARSVPDSEGD